MRSYEYISSYFTDPWILYLVRDPRGVMNSRKAILSSEARNFTNYNRIASAEYCERLQASIRETLLNGRGNRTLLVGELKALMHALVGALIQKCSRAYTDSYTSTTKHAHMHTRAWTLIYTGAMRMDTISSPKC